MKHYLPKIWLAIVLSLMAIFIALIPNSRVNSNLFDLLPSQDNEQYSQEIIDKFTTTLDQQLIWLVSSDKNIEESAQYWTELLAQTEGIATISGQKSPEMLAKWAQSTLSFSSLLTKSSREKMKEGEYVSWVLSQIYSPFSGISVAEVRHDPLLLMRSTVLEQLTSNSQFSMKNGWIVVTGADEREWVMIRATVDPSYQGMVEKKQLVATLKNHQEDLQSFDSTAMVLKKGSVYYSDFAIQTAEQDIQTIGVISTLGIILVFFWVFRSLRAINVVLLSLLIGLLTGTVTVLLIYGEIHIITIVMSTSIIGVSIDYTLLFLTARMLEGNRYSPLETLAQTQKPLLGALVSTLLAYCVLLFAPFAGLTQLAIFTMSGLVAVFLTVICWFPTIATIKERRQEKLIRASNDILAVTQHSMVYRRLMPILIAAISIVGITQLAPDDDIGALQALPPQLLLEDQKINALLKQSSAAQVLMVTGANTNNALENLEGLYGLFDRWVEDGVIESYQAYPFQSIQRQSENIELLQRVSADLQDVYESQAMTVSIIEDNLKIIQSSEWLASPLSEGWSLLWETIPGGESAIIVSLGNVIDIPALIDAVKDQPNLFWVDRKADISDLFSKYRSLMEWLLGIAVCLVVLLFLIFKGIHQGFRMSVPIVLAVLFPLGIMGLAGVTLNLFNVLALILVVGMSIDYVLFFSSGQQQSRNVALITIVMAAIISELTFGLLALSGTNAIAGFGLMLLLGILTALFLSPLAMNKKEL